MHALNGSKALVYGIEWRCGVTNSSIYTEVHKYECGVRSHGPYLHHHKRYNTIPHNSLIEFKVNFITYSIVKSPYHNRSLTAEEGGSGSRDVLQPQGSFYVQPNTVFWWV